MPSMDSPPAPDIGIEIAPDKFDERYRTTKKEIYAYYRCVCQEMRKSAS